MSDQRRKLTEQQVFEIRQRRTRGETYGYIALRTGIDKAVIWRIVNGLIYKNVNEKPSTPTANT